MLTSSQPASFPSRICTSTSLPPAMMRASGCARSNSIACGTEFASYNALMSYISSLPAL